MKSKLIVLLIFGVYISLLLPFLPLQHFTDEYEHAMAGWFLLHGLLPYRDYFSHHAPLPLFLGVLGFLIPRIDPFLLLRVWIVGFHVGIWGLALRLTAKAFRPIIFLTMLLTVLATPVFLLQMALTDTIVSLSLLLLLILLLHRVIYKAPSKMTLIWVYGLLSVVCFWSTVAAVLPLGIILLAYLFVLRSQHDWPKVKALIKPVGVVGFAHVLFPTFFLIIGQFQSFWWSVFTYNTDYYFYLRLAQTELEKKYGSLFQIGYQFVVMIISSWQTFYETSLVWMQSLWGSRVLLLSRSWSEWWAYLQLVTSLYMTALSPVRMALSLVGSGIAIWLILHRRWQAAVGFVAISISLFFRSNEIFHLSPLYLWIVLVLSGLMVTSFYQRRWISVISGGLGVGLLLMSVMPHYFTTVLTRSPYIHPDYSSIASHLQQMTTDNDRIMVMDLNMGYYPLARRLPACRYQYYLPWLHQTPMIRNEMETCLRAATAKALIIPDRNAPELHDLLPLIDANYTATASDPRIYLKQQQ